MLGRLQDRLLNLCTPVPFKLKLLHPSPNIEYSPLWYNVICWEYLIFGGVGGLILEGGEHLHLATARLLRTL